MAFVVIEKHGGWEHATICMTEAGIVKVFDRLADAFTEAENCQDGVVVGDEQVDVDGDETAFVSELDKNVKILEHYAKGTGVSTELRRAISNLSKLKNQVL